MKHFIAALFCLLPFSALAQEAPRSILVLDASGSMWGQIDGVAKIDIAREVIIDLLQGLPAEQELGLTVYGHRRKGDCGDIETIIAPGPNTREAIAEAVRAISPRGKTPLSAAVLQAAEALRYTEERATVILVSDGRETCAGDNPQLTCEMGRRLEETGVDITVHVVGFDVFDIADQAELQCLADETGGIFLTAANASELSQALLVVTEPPAPVEVRIDLRAIEGPSGPEISSGISWQLAALNSSATLSDATSPRPTTELLPGTEATVIVTRAKDGATVSHSFTVKTAGQLITLVLPELPPEPSTVSFVAREGNNRGPIITGLLVWDLYSGDGTAIGQTRSSASGIANELLPGSYRIEVLRPEDEASATATFVVNEATLLVTMILPELIAAADIQAPDSAVAGSKIPVAWTGPGDPNDYITVADPGAPPTSNYQYSYTRETTVLLRMPPAAGTYELRYIDRLTRRILARRPITITPVSVTLEAPAEATAGANAMITWVGPDYQGDYLSVAEIGTGDSSSINYSYTKYGSPLQLQMPTKPGTYELRYVMQISRTVVARRNITVTDLATTVTGPASGPAGSTITVEWTGGDYQSDIISTARVGDADSRYVTYTYTREGSPLQLRLPVEPGDYELRYVLSQDRKVAARSPIRIDPVTATLEAAQSVAAGAQLTVTWQGPAYGNDFITVAEQGSQAGQYSNYTYAREDSPLNLLMPTKPGEYEIRYILVGNNRVILASLPISVTPVTASLTAAASAAPGSNLTVSWVGPDYRGDYIAISRAGDDGYEVYSYTRSGSPLVVKVPDRPGAYELRYVVNQGRTVISRMALTVE